MEKHSEFAKIQYFANLHKDSVLGIKYLTNNQTGIYELKIFIVNYYCFKFFPWLILLGQNLLSTRYFTGINNK